MFCECLQLISLLHLGNDHGQGAGGRGLELSVIGSQVRGSGSPEERRQQTQPSQLVGVESKR